MLEKCNFQKSKNSELVAVMRRTAEKAEDYARRHHVHKWYDDADKLIKIATIKNISYSRKGNHISF